MNVANINVGKIKDWKMKFGKMNVEVMKVGNIKVGKTKDWKMKFGKMKVGKKKVGNIKVGKIKDCVIFKVLVTNLNFPRLASS